MATRSLIIGGRYMVVGTWSKSVRINVLRSVLKQGFTKHLSENLLVQHMIEAKDSQETPMSLYGPVRGVQKYGIALESDKEKEASLSLTFL